MTAGRSVRSQHIVAARDRAREMGVAIDRQAALITELGRDQTSTQSALEGV